MKKITFAILVFAALTMTVGCQAVFSEEELSQVSRPTYVPVRIVVWDLFDPREHSKENYILTFMGRFGSKESVQQIANEMTVLKYSGKAVWSVVYNLTLEEGRYYMGCIIEPIGAGGWTEFEVKRGQNHYIKGYCLNGIPGYPPSPLTCFPLLNDVSLD